ncbi:type II secretion system F family protein [Ornithinimicrobium panacihumi]|uniref:type II secretion system F family protein n=1 Tax=Ornithinimicrobium panacihumi TaxID=2008449 RepID=UPI003F8968FF
MSVVHGVRPEGVASGLEQWGSSGALLPTLAVLAALAVLVWPSRASGRGSGQGVEERRAVLRGPTGGRRARGGDERGPLRPLRGAGAWLFDRWRRSGDRWSEEVRILDGLAAGLEAGLPTAQALAVTLEAAASGGRRSWEWEPLVRAAREGQDLATAWARVGRRTGSHVLEGVARSWRVAASTGAPLATAVRSSAASAREHRRLARAIRSASAGARATVLVLSLLPVAGVAMAALIGIGPMELYGSPVSAASAALGVVLLGVGHLIVHRLVRHVMKGLE